VERNLRIIHDYREHVGCDILTRKQYQDLVVISELAWQIEAYRQRYGRYPEVVCADKIYRTRENLRHCQEKGIHLSGPKLGRPLQEREKNRERLRQQRRTEREDERTRIAVEGKFGEGKRRYSLDRIGTKLRETSESAI
jgi:IS5 family transposase